MAHSVRTQGMSLSAAVEKRHRHAASKHGPEGMKIVDEHVADIRQTWIIW